MILIRYPRRIRLLKTRNAVCIDASDDVFKKTHIRSIEIVCIGAEKMIDINGSMDGDKDGIVFIKNTPEYVCGGTNATQDTKAPTIIESKDMVLFDVTCSFRTLAIPADKLNNDNFRFVSAFAIPSDKGSFVYLNAEKGVWPPERTSSWSLIKDDVFPELVDLVNENDLIKGNGRHSFTSGLPENFGGEVLIKYASGEKISYSNNQSPIICFDAGQAITKFFLEALQRDKVALPEVSSLEKIRYYEIRDDGGYTDATLVLNADGTGTNIKKSKYEGTKVYESEKPMDADTVSFIKRTIENSGLLAWEGLPKRGFDTGRESTLTFFFKDHDPITIDKDTHLPSSIGGGFFNIELEMTTKH